MKYQGTYEVILCGDLNGTLLETRSNKHDKLLRNFVTELQLSTRISCGTTPTFHHHAGTSSSQIDYILVQNRQLVSSYNILDKSPICSSAYVTVLAKMNITLPYASQTVNQRQKKVIKLNWDRADRQLYRASVEKELTPLNRQDSLDQQLSAVTESLVRASNRSVPKKTVGLKGPRWKASPKVKHSLKTCKRLYSQWVAAGKIPNHIYHIQLKSEKKETVSGMNVL